MKLQLSPEEMAERQTGIGGSDAFTVVHGTPEDRYRLFQEKIGEKQSRKIMSDWAYAWRQTTEALQLDWYEHMHPGSQVTHRGTMVRHPEYRFMRVTLDGKVEPINVPINCKQLSKWTKDAREWCIEHYTCQAHHEAVVLDADYALLSLIHGEKEPEIIQIDVDPFYAGEIIQREGEFWEAVVAGVPPADCAELAIPKTARELPKLRVVQLDEEFRDTWPNYAMEMITYLHDFRNTKAAADAHAISRKQIAELTPEDVGLIERENIRVKRDLRGLTISLKKEKP